MGTTCSVHLCLSGFASLSVDEDVDGIVDYCGLGVERAGD